MAKSLYTYGIYNTVISISLVTLRYISVITPVENDHYSVFVDGETESHRDVCHASCHTSQWKARNVARASAFGSSH